MKTKMSAMVLLGAMFMLAGCGGDEECQVRGSNGKTYDCDPEAEQKCEQLLVTYCDRVAECSWFVSENGCMDEVRALIDCSTAAAVTEGYQGCLSDIHNFDCSALRDELPSSCQGAVLASKSGGNQEPEYESDISQSTIWDSSYTVTHLSVTVSKYKPNDDNWDALGGAPDILVNFYVDGDFAGATGTAQDTFDAAWNNSEITLDFTKSSKLVIELLDKDLTADDGIDEVVIEGNQLQSLIEQGSLQLTDPADSIESLGISVSPR